MRLISVVLGAKTDRIRFNESEKLLTWGFRFFETVTPIKPDATFVTQRVWFGDKSEVNLGAGEAGSVTKNGERGGTNNRFGKGGADKVFAVPLGTIVRDEETGKILCDVYEDGEKKLLARGGNGGKGNSFSISLPVRRFDFSSSHFPTVTSVNIVPKRTSASSA